MFGVVCVSLSLSRLVCLPSLFRTLCPHLSPLPPICRSTSLSALPSVYLRLSVALPHFLPSPLSTSAFLSLYLTFCPPLCPPPPFCRSTSLSALPSVHLRLSVALPHSLPSPLSTSVFLSLCPPLCPPLSFYRSASLFANPVAFKILQSLCHLSQSRPTYPLRDSRLIINQIINEDTDELEPQVHQTFRLLSTFSFRVMKRKVTTQVQEIIKVK